MGYSEKGWYGSSLGIIENYGCGDEVTFSLHCKGCLGATSRAFLSNGISDYVELKVTDIYKSRRYTLVLYVMYIYSQPLSYK